MEEGRDNASELEEESISVVNSPWMSKTVGEELNPIHENGKGFSSRQLSAHPWGTEQGQLNDNFVFRSDRSYNDKKGSQSVGPGVESCGEVGRDLYHLSGESDEEVNGGELVILGMGISHNTEVPPEARKVTGPTLEGGDCGCGGIAGRYSKGSRVNPSLSSARGTRGTRG
ncbi:hypothetical protein ADUPG1_002931 [Aduncisulcus paluster]|uniref:Uncharacterized protein n=1 Tax=Aduncisulcus paluster TaxID=2918883 RepID=A0ABQ5KSZ5_9EUKA|nr:hypothetical protein ADUPG1_002931 [Aduncisulcus paluster]